MPATEPIFIASCWLTAGAAAPLSSDERSPERFVDRVRAASDAGFRGFGLLHADLVAIRDTIGFEEMRAILDEFAMEVLELEMLTDWYTAGSERLRSDQMRTDLLDGAARLGARHIKAGADYRVDPVPFEVLVPEFKLLAKQAEDSGTRISIEPIAFANVRTPADGVRLVEAADHPAAALTLDIWHPARLGLSMDVIRDVPVELIASVELNDGDAQIEGTLIKDTINCRRLPGEGVFDLTGFIQSLWAIGYQGPWGLEVISRYMRALPMPEAIEKAMASGRHALETAQQ